MIPRFDDDHGMAGRDDDVMFEALDNLAGDRWADSWSMEATEMLEQDFDLSSDQAVALLNDYLDNYFNELAAKHEEEYSNWSDGDDLNFYCEP